MVKYRNKEVMQMQMCFPTKECSGAKIDLKNINVGRTEGREGVGRREQSYILCHL